MSTASHKRRALPPGVPPLAAPLSVPHADLSGTLLLVDDEPLILDVLQAILAPAGHRLLTAANGREALEVLARDAVDLILLDLMMPELNGFAVCQRIKTSPHWRTIPIIVLTALDQPEDYVRAIECGADDFMCKPLNKTILLARVRGYLRAKQATEAADRAKAAFFANMTHELRTPLHGILSFARFGLAKAHTAPPEKLYDYFAHIAQSGQSLLTLLNDLLDLSKLEADGMTLTFEPVDLGMLATMVVEEFQILAAERQLTLHWRQPGDKIDATVDPEKIKQVLRNLLSNAVKFSPPGGTITIDLGTDDRTALVAIGDQGPGIPEDELETVFDKFVQSSATKNSAGGTGLGLAICREILALHHGRIWVEDGADGGAVFACEFPLQRPDGAGAAAPCR